MYLLTPLILLRLWFKGRRLPAYRQRIRERFGLGLKDLRPVDIWIHAVSLGEVIAATPLIDALLHEKRAVLVTTMTPTGSERVKTRFGDQVSHCYIPYDLPHILTRFFRKIQPKAGIIMETELWPNLIHHAFLAKIPLFLANARLSERSLKGYKKAKHFFKPILNQFTGILAQGESDAEHFIELGARKSLVRVMGNMKFDMELSLVDSGPFKELKHKWGKERTVLIAASTHEDEESQILKQLKTLQAAIPDVLLILVPRHPERFKAIFQLCVQSGFNIGLRSNIQSISSANDIIVVDSVGELIGFYLVSDYAFVGGSLVPNGGHNVLEPIAVKIPVLSGPYVHNFKAICKALNEVQAIQFVKNAIELVEVVVRLHHNDELKKNMVERATLTLESNKGAVERHRQEIEVVL